MEFNPPHHQFCNSGSRSTAGIPAIVYIYSDLAKESKHVNDKQNLQRKLKPHLFLNT